MAEFKRYRKIGDECVAAPYEEGMEQGFVTRYRRAETNEDGSYSTWGIGDDEYNIPVQIPYFYNAGGRRILAGKGWTVIKDDEGHFVDALPTHVFREQYLEL
jgi:hypothetical protein